MAKRKSSLLWDTIVPCIITGSIVALGSNFPDFFQGLQQRWNDSVLKVPADRPPIDRP